jgi:hypothetical protein
VDVLKLAAQGTSCNMLREMVTGRVNLDCLVDGNGQEQARSSHRDREMGQDACVHCAWMIEGGPPTGAVRPRVFVVCLAALTTCTRAGS